VNASYSHLSKFILREGSCCDCVAVYRKCLSRVAGGSEVALLESVFCMSEM
jgi:hypothetical protein